jgi:formyltetrahydrofolate synthetase
LATEIGLKQFDSYGQFKAKITQKVPKGPIKGRGKYVVVTGITPTPLGEGQFGLAIIYYD